MKFRKTYQKFNTFIYLFHFFHRLSVWIEILRGFTKLLFKQMLKVSDFYLEKQKKIIPKKIFFRPLSISKQKSFVSRPNFQGRFWPGFLFFSLIEFRKGIILHIMCMLLYRHSSISAIFDLTRFVILSYFPPL